MDIKRFKNESEIDYKFRICDNRKDLGLNTWNDVAEVLNQELGYNRGESAYRKWYKSYKSGYEKALSEGVDEDTQIQKLTIKKLEVQKERNKLQAEKNEINKWIREQARTENIYEKIELAISNLDSIQVPEHIEVNKHRDNLKTLVIDIADAHFGTKFEIRGFNEEIISQYSTEIFYKRMWELLERTVEIIKKEQIEFVTVLNLSDSIDGLLHLNQLLTLELGVIDSSIQFAEFMAQWLNKLSEYVQIEYRACRGNHMDTRPLNSNRGDFKNENMERVINELIKIRLINNKNIIVHDSKELVYFDVLGTKILATHGQYEKNLETSIKDYIAIYNQPIHILKTGHLHHNNNKTIGMSGDRNIEFVQSPAICGANDHSMTLKKVSKAGTLITLFGDKQGKICTYDIKFNI